MQFSHQHDEAIVNGVSRIGRMSGGTSPLWDDEEMADVFLHEAKSFVTAQADKPFFLYYALLQPHVPRVPAKRLAGATDRGPRGDVIVEMDWCVGELIEHLDELGLTDDTLVIFTSDNGPVLDDGYVDDAAARLGDHRTAGSLRGGKYSLYDGGTRVPTITAWPGRIAAGEESEALLCQVDFLATFAALVGASVPFGQAPDSLEQLTAWLGETPVGRDELVVEGIFGVVMRAGDWTKIPPNEDRPGFRAKGNQMGFAPEVQLYDLGQDIGQVTDMADE